MAFLAGSDLRLLPRVGKNFRFKLRFSCQAKPVFWNWLFLPYSTEDESNFKRRDSEANGCMGNENVQEFTGAGSMVALLDRQCGVLEDLGVGKHDAISLRPSSEAEAMYRVMGLPLSQVPYELTHRDRKAGPSSPPHAPQIALNRSRLPSKCSA